METKRFVDYGDAIAAALEWLKGRGVATLDEAYESRSGGFGMRTMDGSAGYRIEFDSRSGAHINVWWHKVKGAHHVFQGNEGAVRTKWRQLFFWDPKLKRRSSEDSQV